MIELTDGEKKALEAINIAHDSLVHIDGKTLEYNHTELTQAIHVLQSFLKQHILNRISGETWSAWWSSR